MRAQISLVLGHLSSDAFNDVSLLHDVSFCGRNFRVDELDLLVYSLKSVLLTFGLLVGGCSKVLLLQHVELLLAIPLLSVFGPQLNLKLADPRLLCSDLFISSENSPLNFLLKLDGLNHNLIWCFLRITTIPGIDGWSCGKQLLSTVARCLVLFLECHSTY